MQIVNGIAEAVNGDGNSEQMMEDIGLENKGNITVLLTDLPQQRLSELVAEVQDRISHWKVNPFNVVKYGGGRKLTFYLKSEDKIKKLCERQHWYNNPKGQELPFVYFYYIQMRLIHLLSASKLHCTCHMLPVILSSNKKL